MFNTLKSATTMLAATALLAVPHMASAKPSPRPPLALKETTTATSEICRDAFNRNRTKIEALYRRGDSPAIATLMHEGGCVQAAGAPAGTDNPAPQDWWIVCRFGFRYLCIFGTGEPPKEYFS